MQLRLRKGGDMEELLAYHKAQNLDYGEIVRYINDMFDTDFEDMGDVVYHLHILKGMSFAEVGRVLGIDTHEVSNIMEKNNITPRSHGDSRWVQAK